jgi:hypothetical protein
VRDHVYIEEDMPPMERAPHLPHKAKTLVTADARITAYSGGKVEVYDRRNDSNELNNLGVTDAEGVLVTDMKQKLLDSLIRYSDMARLNPD